MKGGANYNVTEKHNVFANIGYFSRPPHMQGGVFLQNDVSNIVNSDAMNEKVFSMELGYGFRSSWLNANVNFYRTAWMDKATRVNVKEDRDAFAYLTGIDALHQGIE
ncbi:MAG: TonB-dependent receptor, partial [Butyricimonas paravirosa]